MEDERIRALLEKVTNFNWEEPRPSALRAEYEAQKAKLHDLWDASTDEVEKAKLWGMYKAPAPAEVRAEYDEYRKRLMEFRRALRRDFPEWHYADGSRVGWFVGGEGSHTPSELREAWQRDDSIQRKLRKVWKLASTGEADKAKRELRRMSEYFMHRAELVLETTVSPRKTRLKEAATLRQMVETLEWLQRRLGSLKVCGNPKCASGRKWFFKIYPNDRYCCARCIAKAKALRQAKRDAESQKPLKVPTFTEEHRKKMAIAAEKRWAKVRASKGKKKYETS
jgi:hypothetical protein